MISIVRDDKINCEEKYQKLLSLQNSDPVRYDIKQNFKTKSLGYTSVAISALEYAPELFIRLNAEDLIDVKHIYCSKNASNTMSVVLPLIYLNKSNISGETRSEIVKKWIAEDKVIFDKPFTTSGYLPQIHYPSYEAREKMSFGSAKLTDNFSFIDILLCQKDYSVIEFMLENKKADYFIQSQNKRENLFSFRSVTENYDALLKKGEDTNEVERYFDILNLLGFNNKVGKYFNLHEIILEKLSKNPNISEKGIIESDFSSFHEKFSGYPGIKKTVQTNIVSYYEKHLNKIKDMELLLNMINKYLIRTKIPHEELNQLKDMVNSYLSAQQRDKLAEILSQDPNLIKNKVVGSRI